MTRHPLADAVAATIAAATAFALSLAAVSDVDFFWHLAVGRHIAQHHALPGENLWSFTAPAHPFAATAWLFDWCAYQLHAAFGIPGVQVAVALVLGAAFALVFLTARRLGAPTGWALTLSLAAAAASQTRLVQRPHAVSYLLLALVGLGVTIARDSKRRWPLVVAPLVIALWSNFHAGAVFGTGLVGLYAIAAWVDRFRKRDSDPFAWSASAAACVVALVANPSGLEEIRYALFHLRSVTTVVELGEFGSPTLATHAPFWILLGLGAIGLWAKGRRVDVAHLLAFVAFGVLAGRAMYVAPMFSIVTAPFTAVNLAALAAPVAGRTTRAFRLALAALAPAGVLLGALALAPEPLLHFASRIHLGPDPFRVPEAGAAAAKAMGISGRCFTSWDLSGFTEFTLPDSPVYADPRLLAYPPEVFTQLDAAEQSQPGFDALMDRYGVEWAFRSHQVMRLSGLGRFPVERWALVYWDEASIIFLRRGLPKFEALIREHELRYFLPAASPFDSWRELQGEARATWSREVAEAAGRSPLLSSAQIASCLQQTRAGNLGEASRACDAAVAGVHERERFHPLEGQARRVEAAIALALLGQGWQRAGDPRGFSEALAQAELLGRGSAEVFSAIGGMYLATEPEKA
ncbi:MAG: hypothetical protein H6Q89_4634, partial [Myxococcaceae bacterium]|nr:hypothetical protein [Myxococcaceae bacterium]